MARVLSCPECGKDDVLRAQCFSLRERFAELLRVSPFRCQQCHHRFLAWRVGRSYPTQVIDRRAHRRIPVRLALSFSGGRVQGKGTVLDISMGGCIIHSETRVQVNDLFYLQLYLTEQQAPIEVAAMVRSVSRRGIGFQ
ncbi:MAG: PilZ domain-containing protein, partial [Nitrospiraceae bacterium]